MMRARRRLVMTFEPSRAIQAQQAAPAIFMGHGHVGAPAPMRRWVAHYDARRIFPRCQRGGINRINIEKMVLLPRHGQRHAESIESDSRRGQPRGFLLGRISDGSYHAVVSSSRLHEARQKVTGQYGHDVTPRLAGAGLPSRQCRNTCRRSAGIPMVIKRHRYGTKCQSEK